MPQQKSLIFSRSIGHVGGVNVTSIKKRNGAMEEFMPEKTVVSLVRSGVGLSQARQEAKQIESQVAKLGTSEAIRNQVLKDLKGEYPRLAQDWQTYDRIVKHRR